MVDNTRRIDELKRELAKDATTRQFYQLGELLRREGRLGEAAEVLRGGLGHHARYVAAWVALGRTCLDLGHGREGEAAEALTQALGLDPQNPVAWRLLGEARLASGERAAALEAMERALALVPGDEVLKSAVEALQSEVSKSPQPAAISPKPVAVPSPSPVALPPSPPESAFSPEEAPFDFDAGPIEIRAVPGAESGDEARIEVSEGETGARAGGELVVPEPSLLPDGEVFDVFGEQAPAKELESGVQVAAADVLLGEKPAPDVAAAHPPIFAPPPELPESLVVVGDIEGSAEAEAIAAAEAPASVFEEEGAAEAEPELPLATPEAEGVAILPVAESTELVAAESMAGGSEIGLAGEEEPVQEGEPRSDAQPEAEVEPPEQVEEPLPDELCEPPSVGDAQPPASITLARMYLHQQQMKPAIEVLERLLQHQPENEEARELLSLVCDMLEVAPAMPSVSLTVAERKIASLQRWLARVQVGREGVAS